MACYIAMEDEAEKQHQRQKLVTPDNQRQMKCNICERTFRRESDRRGTNVKVNERSQLVEYSVRDVKGGSVAKVAL